MHRHRDACALLVGVQPVVNGLDVVVFPGECLSSNRDDSNRVFVNVLVKVFGSQPIVTWLERYDAWLDIEIAQEFLPDNLHVAARHHIGSRGVLALRLAFLPPVPFVREARKHAGLGRADGRRAIGLRTFGPVPELMQPAHHPLLVREDLRVHIVVDIVLEDVARSNLSRLRLRPRRHERRHIQHRIRVGPFFTDYHRGRCTR
ncbi:hypothetical protein D3C87_1146860 [compost metagenome]